LTGSGQGYAVPESACFALPPVYALGLGMAKSTAAALLSVWLSGNTLPQYPLGWLADRRRRERAMA
jgi:MFS family permease